MEYTTYRVQPQQSLLDVAVQNYGSVMGVYFLLEDNPHLGSVIAVLHAGDTLRIRNVVIDNIAQERAQKYGVFTLGNASASGIAYWTIGKDFVIS